MTPMTSVTDFSRSTPACDTSSLTDDQSSTPTNHRLVGLFMWMFHLSCPGFESCRLLALRLH